jgi:hypothetical protein
MQSAGKSIAGKWVGGQVDRGQVGPSQFLEFSTFFLCFGNFYWIKIHLQIGYYLDEETNWAVDMKGCGVFFLKYSLKLIF